MSLSKENNSKLRDLLLSEVDKECSSTDEVSIGLSSGIDSHVVLFALLELSKRVNVFSFHKEDLITKDFKCAKNTAEILGLNFVEVVVPSKIDISRIERLIKFFDLKKKTDIEVLYTMSFVFEKMNSGKAFFGYPDHHFGLSQKAMRYYRKTLELNQEWRTLNASEKGMRQSLKWKEIGSVDYNLDVKLPLGNKPFVDFFHPFTWDEMNRPKLKQPFLDCFSDYFGKVKVRQPQPLQCGDTGIREIFNQLIDSDLNCNNTSNLVKLYRDIWNSRKNKLGAFINA